MVNIEGGETILGTHKKKKRRKRKERKQKKKADNIP